MNSLFLKEFFEKIRPDLRRMSYKTQGESSLGDLENEAYLLLEEFIQFHDREPDLCNPQDTRWVTSRLYNKFVKWSDNKFKYALRIDNLENDEDKTWTLDLPASDGSDPLIEILFKEEVLAHQSLLDDSYSEAKAYVITFDTFKHEKEALSNYWYITSATLDKRFNRAIKVLTHQPSLFDLVEIIDESFIPKPGKEKITIGISAVKEQLTWNF